MPVILVLLLVLAGPARAMTSQEFDQYWIGGGLNAAGRCSTIVHPRVLTTAAGLATAVDWADDAGTPNAFGKSQLDLTWSSKHGLNPLPTTAYMPGLIANVYLDAAKRANTQWAAECTTYVGKLFDGNVECGWPTTCGSNERPLEGNYASLGLFPVTPLMYDLTYNELNASRKRHAIVKSSRALCGSKDEDSGGAKYQWTNYKALPLLAIYGDSANAGFNGVVKDTLLSVINYWERRACPCMDSLDNIGYAENYFSQRTPVRLHLVAAMQRCFPGYDSPLYHSPAITQSGTFLRQMCRTDALTPQGANQFLAMARGPDKFNVKGWAPAATLSLVDALFGDKDSWIVANNLGSNNLCWGPTTQSAGPASTWPLLLWFNPHKYTEAIALADIQELYEWNEKWGIFGCRSAWNAVGASNTDVQTFYYPFYIEGAGHLNAGHWQMNVGADGVFVNSGVYANADLEDQYQVWLAQSISKNTIGVWQSGETTFDGKSTYVAGDKGMAAGCATLPTDPYLASGYQIRGNSDEGHALFGGFTTNGGSSWHGGCNNHGQTKGQLYVRGTHVQEALVRGAAYYIASDLSKAYNAPKEDFVRRAFYTDGAGTAIILDQVQVGPSVRMVTSAYHTVGPATSAQNYAPFNQAGTITPLTLNGVPAPSATDSIRVDADGGRFADSRGGGYRIDGNTINETASAAVKNLVGNSAGWMFPLEVRNVSTNSNGYLLCIGGPGKGGAHWKTNKYPCVTNLFSANRWDEGREYWVWDADDIGTGWNAAPSSHATASGCPAMSCAQGITRFRMSANTSDWSGNVASRNNDVGPSGSGHGKDAADWSTYTVVPNPGDSDLCESFVVCIGTSSTASKPTVRYTHTGEIVAVAVNQGSGFTVHVVPTATFGPRATTISWDNPLTSEDATYKAVGAEPGFAFDLQDQLGNVIRQVTADDQGYLTWFEDTGGVSTFTLSPHDPYILYPPPTPPPGHVPYVLAHPRLYHPRERTVLQAGGGTQLALYYGEGDYGAPIFAQLSRDDGQTWRDLEGNQFSATELLVDDEDAGPNRYTPRGDYGFSAALDPVSNDLWIFAPYVRMNASHVEIASLVRAQQFPWDGTTWSTFASFQWNGFEGLLRSKPRECVARVSAGRQFYGAWAGRAGSLWNVQSVRIKSGTATALSSSSAKADSSQYPQLLEYPRGTMWLLSSVREGSSQDSIRVRTATDGSAAQWGVTSHVPLEAIGARGEWGAVVGPSGPWLAIRDEFDDRYRYAYWNQGSWVTGFAPAEAVFGDHPSVTAAGVTRVVLTSTHGSTLSRAYWSLSDGWSTWEDAWTATGLGYAHVIALRPADFLALGTVGAATDFAIGRFSLPSETEPTGACCIDGDCTLTTASECTGTYQGNGTDCSDPYQCDEGPRIGACCLPAGDCITTNSGQCPGAYQGDNTDCDPNPCPAGPPSLAGRRRKVILAARE